MTDYSIIAILISFIILLTILFMRIFKTKKEHFQQLIQILSNGDLYWWPKNNVKQNMLPISDPFIGNVQPVYVDCKTHPSMCYQLKTPYLQHQVRYGYNPNAYPNNPTWAY